MEATRRTGMLVFLGSDAITFAALLVAFVYLRVVKDAPGAAFVDLTVGLAMTAALLASSVAVWLRRRWIAILLGAAFVALQAWEWTHLGVALADGHAAASFYIVTGFHGLHVLAAIVLMATIRFELAALFWQFVDAVWIAIFLCVYLS